MVTLPCGDGNRAIHSRCELVAVRGGEARRGAQAPLCRQRAWVRGPPGAGSTMGNGRPLVPLYRPTPVFARSPLPYKEGHEEDDEGYREGLYYPRNQDSFARGTTVEPLGRVSLNDLQMRSTTVAKMQLKLETT